MRRIALFVCIAASVVIPDAAGAAPRAAGFEGALGGRAVAAAAGTPWTSEVVRPGRTFSVVGLKWRSAAAQVDAQVRVRDARGWHRWTAVPHAHSARSSDPVWAGRATAVQVRAARRVA